MKLEEIYNVLLEKLVVDGNSYARIMHPLFYTYPYALRFEIGLPELAEKRDWETYTSSAIERVRCLYHNFFELTDQVLVIIDRTPDPEMKAAFSECTLRRLRSKLMSPFVDDLDDDDDVFFYRYLYGGTVMQIPADLIFKKIVVGEVFGGRHPYYSSSVYFYNITKSLLFHLYDDRGADVVAFSRDTLIPYYNKNQDMLLDWDREEMARKLGLS